MTYPQALNELIGTKFKIVSGYPGGNEITLALEKGEIEGYCGWAIGSIKQRAPQWLHDGTLKVLAQFTLGKPDLPNVPLASDLPKTPEGRKAIEMLAADSVLAWPLDGTARPAGGTRGRTARRIRCHDGRSRIARGGRPPKSRCRRRVRQ